MRRWIGLLACVVLAAGCAKMKDVIESEPLRRGSEIVAATAGVTNPDPYVAGKEAALALQRRFIREPRVVIVAECFEGEAQKAKALKGVCKVFPRAMVFGAATYGGFTQDGCLDRDAVTLLGIGGAGMSATVALERNLGMAELDEEKDAVEIEKRLRAAGERLAAKLPKRAENRLLIVFADAHSPKNAYLVEGVQDVMGKPFPITGGSANKNAGQTFVYYQGRMFADSAIAILIAGDFALSMQGRQAKDNDKVVSTAKDAASETRLRLKGDPIVAIAFDCAGRKGKLKNIEDELRAMQGPIGKTTPLFGCYGAGEIGPPDQSEAKPGVFSVGVGWHLMFTMIGK